MSHAYDATTKFLLDLDPGAWADFLGVPYKEVRLLDSDLSTVTASGDGALFIKSTTGIGRHIEYQRGRYKKLPERTLFHNRLFHNKYQIPVKSVIFLLTSDANGSFLTGRYEEREESGAYLTFLYEIIKLYEIPVERILQSRLAILPLAPLSKVSKAKMPGVIAQLKRRFAAEAPPQPAEYIAPTRDLRTRTSALRIP